VVILVQSLIVFACSSTKSNVIQESNTADEPNDISGYTIANISYTLLSNDPAKVRSITLDVAPSDGADEDVDARITIDNGATWIACTYPADDKWFCNFPTSHEPSIASISNVRLITKTAVPWHKKLAFSILQIFN